MGYTKQYLQILYALMSGKTISVKDVDGTDRTLPYTGSSSRRRFDCTGFDNDDTHGIVVGDDDTAETNDDYKLGNQILEADFAHQFQTGDEVTIDSGKVVLKLRREFLALSSQTIKEVGLYARIPDSNGTYRFFCIFREVLAVPKNVNSGQTGEAEITWETTV